MAQGSWLAEAVPIGERCAISRDKSKEYLERHDHATLSKRWRDESSPVSLQDECAENDKYLWGSTLFSRTV
jgi:hypothetical protein